MGPCWAHVGLGWAHLGPSLGLCWAHVGPRLGQLGPMLAYVGRGCAYVGPMLVRGGAVYVENSVRDKFLRFFPPRKAKTVEKPTFFNIAKVQFCAAEGPETL